MVYSFENQKAGAIKWIGISISKDKANITAVVSDGPNKVVHQWTIHEENFVPLQCENTSL